MDPRHLLWILIFFAVIAAGAVAIVRAVRRSLGRDSLRNELNRIDSRLSSIEKTLKDIDSE